MDAPPTPNQSVARRLALWPLGGLAVVLLAVSLAIGVIAHRSSKKIANIISVIDGISFQTDILALNAAVEAARAGEQGHRFVVVASEARSLAQRSAEAAKEIKTLIGASVKKVESGSRLVQNAGNTMDEIVGSVNRSATSLARSRPPWPLAPPHVPRV